MLVLDMSAADGTFNIADANNLTLGATSMNGTGSTLALNVAGAVTQSAAITARWYRYITAGNVTLTDATNDSSLTLVLDMWRRTARSTSRMQ